MSGSNDDFKNSVLLSEYQNEYDRKGRIHNKTAGYLLIELFELMISLTVTSMAFSIIKVEISRFGRFSIIITLISIFYFTGWSFGISFKFYKNHKLMAINTNHLGNEDANNDIMEAMVRSTRKNREINERLSGYNGLLFAFLVIDSICFSLFLVSMMLSFNGML